MIEIFNCEYDSQEIIKQAKENGMQYLSLEELWENRKYFVKSYGVVWWYMYDMINYLHKDVTNIVKYLSTNRNEMLKLLPEKIVDIIIKKPWWISQIQRYDIIFDEEGNPKICEVNSETPAWIPETVNTYLFNDYTPSEWIVNSNALFETLCSIWLANQWEKEVDVVFYDDSNSMFNKIWEDYTNALYLSTMYNRECWPSRMVGVEDIFVWIDGIYAYEKKIKAIHSFYPLEWYFLDDGWKLFWEHYLNDKFEIVNWPINLISQSKAFWAWVAENLDFLEKNNIISSKNLFDIFVPKYSFDEKEGSIAKPRLFREGVGIWDPNVDWAVFQEYVEQKTFTINTYEWEKQWYLTFWVYCNDSWTIWTYCRFCENKITDYTSYFLPIYIKEHEETTSLNSIANNNHSWLMCH